MKLIANCITIVGPTASGKSSLALEIARQKQGSIINCDSVQVYRGFDIGSAKATPDERREIPHYLLDVVDWNESYDAARFRTDVEQAIQEIMDQGRLPIICGGTPLYHRALVGDAFHDLPHDPKQREEIASWSKEKRISELQRLDPERAKELHPNDQFRIGRALEIALITGKTKAELTQTQRSGVKPRLSILCKPENDFLKKRIRQRTQAMLANDAWIHEVQGLLDRGCSEEAKPMQAIGYRQIASHLVRNEPKREELEEAIFIATRQYARKQMMWFRKLDFDHVWKHSTTVEEFTSAL